jgi:sporulation-control protein spo0M
VAVPDETPLTIPDEELTVATDVLLELQLPPDIVDVNVVVPPTQIL